MPGLNKLFSGLTTKTNIKIRNVPDGTRIVVVSDMQIPMEDQKLLATIFEDFVPAWKPEDERAEYHLFLNGDVMDQFSLSGWMPRVKKKFDLDKEVDLTKAYLDAWGKEFTHKHFVFGNHEDRWDRVLFANNPEMEKYATRLHDVLELEAKGYDWVPYLKHYDFCGFIITHGDTTVKNAAQRMLETYGAPGTSGHVNRPQSFTWAAAARGEPITWYCTGMTCVRNIGDVIADWRKIQPWQQGFLVGEVHGGVLHVQLVRVIKGGFWAGGKFYRVRKAGK